MRVFVYRNLHQQVWSIKALEGNHKGRVIAHAPFVQLSGKIQFKVSESGRQRVIREKRKNVHAGIVGKLLVTAGATVRYSDVRVIDHGEPPSLEQTLDIATMDNGFTEVTYNPYKYNSFVVKSTEAPVHECEKGFVLLHDSKVFFTDFSL
jgi:hypothetical protein